MVLSAKAKSLLDEARGLIVEAIREEVEEAALYGSGLTADEILKSVTAMVVLTTHIDALTDAD